ncbi:hypothetical protein [Haloplanus aerogenes]|uniref:Uncharacterized protein n=1 Tax=Haloplanus aerogenes TaxID=660522 RepID=A0A3M0CU98_9EURY|nr:hypothetical protein [Haloplanus aerogenes]AZH26698.1 hypothetical protein DU502_15520 [Haloplanus aerogenes]RMB12938.1 hypothetical protein ATH50_3094 [Haloplanus aerogenes]
MPSFDVEKTEITVFEIDGLYLFRQYFDEDGLFQQLEEYYNSERYRFEVPECDLPEISQILDNYFYELKLADNPAEYCAVIDKGIDASDIMRNAVATQRHRDFVIFLLKDKISLKQAKEHGAISLEKSEIYKEVLRWKTDGS